MQNRCDILFVIGLCAIWLLSGCRDSHSGNTPSPKPDPSSPPASRAVEGIRFESIAERAGIHFCYPQEPRPLRALEAFGCGCAILDYDNDGWMDVLLVTKPHAILYHNRGDATFEDVTEAAGLASVTGDWRGCAVGDYEGDGYLDILLNGYRRLALLKNLGGKRFADVTASSGLSPTNQNLWGTSAAFMDMSGSGRLDLILLHYVVFGPKEKQYCELTPGILSGCPPSTYRAEYPELWQNLGNGRFKNITLQAGLVPEKVTHGKALDICMADVDDDGRMDFYIGNDGTPADLVHNLGNHRFENLGLASGVAFGSTGHPFAAMGSDWGDYDRDGRLDLTVTAFSNEVYALFHNLGRNLFEHAEDQTGLSGQTLKPLGFGAKWLDMDNDGWPDITYVNGHVYDNTADIDPFTTYRQPSMLFHNIPGPQGRQFRDLVPEMGGGIDKPIVGRGIATGDIDNDGRIDILGVDYEGPPLLLHNVTDNHNHWITLDLRSDGPNRFAYGARVKAHAGKQIWVADVSPSSGYLSCSDPRIHFGLGDIAVLDSVEIRWSDGRKEVLRHVPGDRFLTIMKGRGIVKEEVENRRKG
jgi:hypothetical protein